MGLLHQPLRLRAKKNRSTVVVSGKNRPVRRPHFEGRPVEKRVCRADFGEYVLVGSVDCGQRPPEEVARRAREVAVGAGASPSVFGSAM